MKTVKYVDVPIVKKDDGSYEMTSDHFDVEVNGFFVYIDQEWAVKDINIGQIPRYSIRLIYSDQHQTHPLFDGGLIVRLIFVREYNSIILNDYHYSFQIQLRHDKRIFVFQKIPEYRKDPVVFESEKEG